jgi:hypothetical protein
LLYCLNYVSVSRVSGAYDHKMHKGKVLDFWKSYARDIYICPPLYNNTKGILLDKFQKKLKSLFEANFIKLNNKAVQRL